MKHIASILLLATCLAACIQDPTRPPVPPFPPFPPPVVNIEPQAPEDTTFEIVEFDADGKPGRTWEVQSFTETDFPRTVTFTGSDCALITLRGSYEIRESVTVK